MSKNFLSDVGDLWDGVCGSYRVCHREGIKTGAGRSGEDEGDWIPPNEQKTATSRTCLIGSGVLSLFVLLLFSTREGNWHPLLPPVAAAAFVPLIPVMLRGDSWQKMLAGALLFVSSFGLLVSVMD